MPQFDKDPNAILDYGCDWSTWLETGDTISTSTWTVPSGLTKVRDSKTPTSTTIWLSGGVLGVTYTLVNHVVTAGGRKEDQTLDFVIREK